jgi:predicted GNAT family N-acyltransferase
MKRSQKDRSLFYSRDSEGRHDQTPGEYVSWAAKIARDLGLRFDGTVEAIETMINQRHPHEGDLFLDYGVQGHKLSRPAFDLLFAEAAADLNVSHILIPRRDRFARPNDPSDAIRLENQLRVLGITIVYMDRTLLPISKGQRLDLGETITSLVDFDRAGKDRRELAQKIIYAQLSLAKNGHSTGGRPPYGFRRWLVNEVATPLRELEEGEVTRRRGHHVVWLPGPENELAIIYRILEMLKEMPAARVARILTDEGVPSPDAGRSRIDNGVKHFTAGVWNQTTIINIAQNSLLGAVGTHGRRSMGDQLRFTLDGPRELDATDFRDNDKPKVVRNDESAICRTPAAFDPLIDPSDHEELLTILKERGKSQRGKPRSRDPKNNPLGGRIFDMNCGWAMYRTPRKPGFRYSCGRYMQHRGCDHNHVDGLQATTMVLSILRQKIATPRLLEKLKERLRAMAARENEVLDGFDLLQAKRSELVQLCSQIATVGENLALAKTPAQYEIVARKFDELEKRRATLDQQIASEERKQSGSPDAEAQVAAAIAVLDRLPQLMADAQDLAKVGEIFRMANARMFLRFERVQVKKRTLNKLKSGVVTFGNAPLPITLYAGPTGRRAQATIQAATVAARPAEGDPLPDQFSSGREGNSLGNVSRGDRI